MGVRAAYYNEFAQYPAAWLRRLADSGAIAPGVVDERRIERVLSTDLLGYRQCHFFAGIGVWSYALRLVGWPDDLEVWTGSCPCQPFSQAGRGDAFEDERHLWPVWKDLIEERRPSIVFGEQVASADGREWLAVVRSQMEALGYVVGAADLCAAGVSAPHIRQRLFFGAARVGNADAPGRPGGQFDAERARRRLFEPTDLVGRMGDAEGARRKGLSRGGGDGSGRVQFGPSGSGQVVGMADGDVSQARGHSEELPEGQPELDGDRDARRVADGDEAGRVKFPPTRIHGQGAFGDHASRRRITGFGGAGASPGGFWDDCVWLLCRPEGPGKPYTIRPAELGVQPLVDGSSVNMERLRAYGNAIVPWAAGAFVLSFVEALADLS